MTHPHGRPDTTGCSGSYDVNAFPRPAGGCVVDGRLIAQSDGVFSDVAPISMASITDGLSHTLFVAERATVNLRSLAAIDPRFYQERGWWIPGNRGATIMTTFYPPGMPTKVARAAGGTHASAASSTHPGGFSALLGDGSVRFIKDTIATWPFGAATGRPIGAERASGGWWRGMPLPSVWQALGTRAGGEVIESDF